MKGYIQTAQRQIKHISSFCTTIYIFLLLTAFLLWPGIGGYAQIASSKIRIFLTVAASYCLIQLVLLLLQPSSFVTSRNPGACCAMLAYIAVTWISVGLSPYGTSCIMGISRGEGSLTITLYCLTALFIGLTAEPDSWYYRGLACTGILMCLISVEQFTGRNPFRLFPNGYTYLDANKTYDGIFSSTIGNTDFLAAVLCLIAAVSAISVLQEKGCWKYAFLMTFLLSVFVLIHTKSAAGLVGLVCGLLLTGCFGLLKSPGRRVLFFRILLVIGFLLVLSFILLVKKGVVNDNMGSGRVYIWKEVWRRIGERPFFGHGPDTMSMDNIQPYGFISYSGQWVSYGYIDTAHNEFLNILYHQGILGLVSYATFFALLIHRVLRSNFEKNKDILIPLAGVLAYLVQSFFSISTAANAPLFWGFTGLLLASGRKGQAE